MAWHRPLPFRERNELRKIEKTLAIQMKHYRVSSCGTRGVKNSFYLLASSYQLVNVDDESAPDSASETR